MKKYTRWLLTLMVAACPWPLLAQAVVPAPAPADTTTTTTTVTAAPTPAQVTAAGATAEAPVQMSPFEVSSSRDLGYAATETLAGTRIRTDLGDVAASIAVYNKNFIDDIGALDIGTFLQYTTNAQVAGTEGTYAGVGDGQTNSEQNNLLSPQSSQRVRGLAAADNARDYYITDIPWDSYNIDRVDILRGPNAMLYGLGSPAGIINAGLNDAEFRNGGEVDMRAGSYGSTRSSLDLNEQLIPGVLAFRLDTMYDDRKYEQSEAFQNQKRIYGALRFDPNFFPHSDFHTTLKANAEAGDISSDLPRILPPNDAITPWWRPNAITASNPFGGMGQTLMNNPYDPWRTTGITAANGLGALQAGTINYQPYLSDAVNQQQPFWLINGNNNQTLAVDGGYNNVGAVDPNGNVLSASAGIQGKGTNMEFATLGNLPGAAINYNLPGAQYGQYRNMAMEDPSIFNFYKTLIDGPTKSEWQKWTAYNVDLAETAWHDRLGLDLTYDRQNFESGGQALLGYSPTLSMDLLKNEDDYYLSGANGETSVTNPNVGRPYVEGASNNGGSSYLSTRQVQRASLFAELRASDFTENDFLVKLLGIHRFNLVGSNEQYFSQNQSWQLYANSQAWDGYWNGNSGASNAFTNRPPVGIVYLGQSITGRSSPSGANIPGITAPITLSSSGVYSFNSTYNGSAAPGAPWSVPSSLYGIYYGVPNPAAGTTVLTQNSNPANYVGWNSSFMDNLLEYNNGQNNNLLTLDEQSFRETTSYVGNYQAYLWQNALVGTLGWRYDEVETKSATATQQPLDRNYLNLAPAAYSLPSGFPVAQTYKNHSTSAGVVLHLNDLLAPHYSLPINISGSFNDSKNFQVTSVRTDVFGHPIGSPLGKTKEYGLTLSTKDNRFSIRVVKYDTDLLNGASTLGNPQGLGTVIAQGLRYRNVFLYDLGGYTLDTANEPSSRNTWNLAYPGLTAAQAQTQEDQAITTWNNIQTTLAAQGFFQAWNFTPTTPGVLVNRTTYLTNPAAYQPNPATVSAYVATPPQGFTVTSDTDSKGYEFDSTFNPTHNWRIEANASEATAIQDNVGGPALDGLVSFLNSQLYSNGSPTPAGLMPQFGNPAFSIDGNQWGPWLQNYTLLKLQEGSDVSELRKWRFNFINDYSFNDGPLKGVGVGGAYRWEQRVVIGYPVLPAGTFDLSHPYYGPADGEVDLWVSYHRMLTNKIGWKIQLNVTNALARNGLVPISIEPDGSTWAGVRVKPIQEFAVTNTFTF